MNSRDLKAKRPGANRTRRRQRDLTVTAIHSDYTAEPSEMQDLLLALAVYRTQFHLKKAKRLEALAASHRDQAAKTAANYKAMKELLGSKE